MIRIAQAASSETFGKYGTAPNQRRTGATKEKPGGNMDGELNIINWKGGWEAVYRAVDDSVAEFIANFFYRAVENGSGIGYSWTGNTGLFDWLKKHNSKDPRDVDTPVNTDCAALTGAAVYNAGIHDDRLRAMQTSNMDNILMSTNAFIKLTGRDLCENGKGIQRGDILWKTGHAACALDSDPEATKPMFYFRKLTFKGVSISAGTPGTRAAQKVTSVAKSGYRPVVARLSYVNDSSLANVTPFFGYGDEDRLCLNFYRASGKSGSIDCNVMVVYVRKEVTG